MKIRIVFDHKYVTLHFVQLKRWWFPIWITTFTGTKNEAEAVYKNLVEHGSKLSILKEGEIK